MNYWAKNDKASQKSVVHQSLQFIQNDHVVVLTCLDWEVLQRITSHKLRQIVCGKC